MCSMQTTGLFRLIDEWRASCRFRYGDIRLLVENLTIEREVGLREWLGPRVRAWLNGGGGGGRREATKLAKYFYCHWLAFRFDTKQFNDTTRRYFSRIFNLVLHTIPLTIIGSTRLLVIALSMDDKSLSTIWAQFEKHPIYRLEGIAFEILRLWPRDRIESIN